MGRADELHLFIDESGKLTGRPAAGHVMLVGGLLVLGSYTPDDDDALRQALRDAAAAAGVGFPQGLHVGAAGHSPETWRRLRDGVAEGVREWAGPDADAAHAVAITHRQDAYDGGSGLFAERDHDNRYVRMLVALLEQLLFVDESVADRLTPDAAVHLHLANRQYVFAADPSKRLELEAQGYTVRQRSDGRMSVDQSLTEREVLAYLRMSCWDRWAGAKLRIGSVRVRSIDYQAGRSDAGLYLADLLLGDARRRMAPAAGRGRVKPILPALIELEYGPWLHAVADAKAAAVAGDVDAYLATRQAAERYAAGRPRERRALAGLDAAAAKALRPSVDHLARVLEDACRDVDVPGRSAAGLRKAQWARSMFPRNGRAAIPARLAAMEIQARLSAANHAGDRPAAEAAWDEFAALGPAVRALGAEGLRLETEVSNRRAVTLTDQFRFDEAEAVLRSLADRREAYRGSVSKAFGDGGGGPALPPDRELGACYGSLGQVCALRGGPGDDGRAEALFRNAIACFADPADVERQWVYLGHLACDRGEAGRRLWNEAVGNLPRLHKASPVAGDGTQYQLALQAKGALIFGGDPGQRTFLAGWQRQYPLRQFDPEALDRHPFGLIFQAAGLLCARGWRRTGSEALRKQARSWFDVATRRMSDGGPLLKVLACAAQLHKSLETNDPVGDRDRQALANDLAVLKGVAIQQLGPAAWSEDAGAAGRGRGFIGSRDPGPPADPAARAREVLGAFRFNYV